ncbi:hypothetical protein NicSoilB4_06190 [Arthrobacter sp. NicSoilB4]|uniref:hypothetical protein n=1 Tax=Arthrobacter sp. NicSoilB4 TaxID=2830997 RepID=UPI001CC58E2F|nr:hypothetical protein [Arthrobacter sp. NicSoilB4]BCW65856.1 hypothetical protein NicSoilB4_06190 [Arthrobacter sp. NicSoilB4]
MQNRFRLKGASLEEIRRKAEQQHGPAARIVSAERVISPGIAGLFAGDRYEAIVEVVTGHEVVTGEVVPDPDILSEADVPAARPAGAAKPAVAAPAHDLKGAAIAALLEEADAAELSLHRPGNPGLSTESPDFAELLEQLGTGLRGPADAPGVPGGRNRQASGTAPAPASALAAGAVTRAESAPVPLRESVPVPLSGTGDLVVLVGLGDDALDTALAMSTAAGGADVRTAGKLSAYGHLHVEGRQGATAARAHAVLTDQTVLVAFGLGKARDALARLQAVAALSADQLWVVVDAGRKQEDSERWVGVLAAQLDITAVAVVGAAETATPETVNTLGLPVGWIDSGQARSARI